MNLGQIAYLRIKFKSFNTYDYIISLIKRRKLYENLLVLHLNKIESLHPRMICAKFGWFWRRGFFNFVNVFSLFRNFLPLGKGGVLNLNKLESHSPKHALCEVWLKLAQWFWRSSQCAFTHIFNESDKVKFIKELCFCRRSCLVLQSYQTTRRWIQLLLNPVVVCSTSSLLNL